MDWIPPQVVVIIEIFVAEHQSVNALTNKLLNTMFDIALVTVVDETVGKISHQTAVAFKFAQVSTLRRHWRVSHPRNLPPLFGYLTLEITIFVHYSLSSKRRPFCIV